jgi:hypothetical protein
VFGIENGECNFEMSLQAFRSVQHFINLENCWIRFSETTLSEDHGQGWYFALELGPLVQSRALQQALGQLPNTSCLQEFLDYDGENIGDPHYTCTKWGHHVSLAYLPGLPLVTYAEMKQLQTKLTQRLQAWILTRHQVALRKEDFLRTKTFKVYDVNDDQSYFKHDLSTWPIDTIQKLVLQNRLRLDEEFPDQDAWARFYFCMQRDSTRHCEAESLIAKIQNSQVAVPQASCPWLHFSLQEDRLAADNPEMHDLLYWLREVIKWEPGSGVELLEMRRDINRAKIFKYSAHVILDSSAWHVTPQLEENGLMCVEGCYEPVSMVYKGLYSPTPIAFYAGTHEEAADAMETQRREPWSISASLLKCFCPILCQL